MAKINPNQLKAATTWLKNYIDSKASSGGSGSTTTSGVTKEYVDNKMLYNGYETLYTIPASDIPVDNLQDEQLYYITINFYFEIDKNGEYMISYAGKNMIASVQSPFDEMDVIATTGETNIIEISPGWEVDPDNNRQSSPDDTKTKSTVKLDNMDLTNLTDIVIKKKRTSPISTKILALSKTEYDAIITKDENTIYIVTNE